MNPRMEKGGIPNHPNDLPFSFISQRDRHTMGAANTRPHANITVDHIERRISSQCIASDISRGEDFQFPQDMEYSPVGTSRAQIGWPWRKFFFEERLGGFKFLSHHSFFNEQWVQLTANREQGFSPFGFETHCLDIFFKKRIQLFDDINLLHFLKELSY